MDDGYWEALLQDVESGVDWPSSRAGGEGTWPDGEGAGTTPGSRETADSSAATAEADWRRVTELLENGETVDVVVTGYNRGGLLADLGSVQGFLPASHLAAPPLVQTSEARMAELATHTGKTLTVRVVEIDRDRRRLILSERMARDNGSADEILATLRPGQICHGQVTSLCPFGAFVDLGGFEGLIHISELSWGRIGSPEEVVHPGDDLDLIVLSVHPQEQKVSLSLKRLHPDPWLGVENRYSAGQIVDAMITNVVDFGAFARLEEGLEGLIHVSELAEGNFMHPRNVVREGDHVRVRVLQVDGARHRIALTMRSVNVPRPLPGIGLT